MYQVEEVPPPQSIHINGNVLKSEVIEQPVPIPTPISITESSVAPPPATQTQLITVPVVAAQPLLTSTPTAAIKRTKRGFRTYLNSKKINRSSGKPATLLARPSTILPHSQKPIIVGNQIAPIIPKSVPTIQTNSQPGFTTYLVVDGNQGQLVQVANDGQQPVTFRNQSGHVLQATPITVVAPNNQPVISSFPVNGDCSLLSNSSQTITTVRTSSSIDLQQQTTLTSDTTTLTTQQFIHQPTTIINQTFENNNSSLDESRTSNSNLSLSITQIAEKVSHRHRRSSSSSLSKKKRGRPRLYERDPFTNKPIKADPTPEVPNTTLLMPGQPTQFTNNTCGSLIFPSQPTQIPVQHPSLLQQHQYSYPSLLNGNASTFNTFPNNSNTTLSSTTFPYSSPPAHNIQIPTTATNSNISNIAQLNSSPVKSTNNDVTVHYIGGFVIRESNQPFMSNESNLNDEQIRCIKCEKIDFAKKFFDQERKVCSKLCSLTLNEIRTPVVNEPMRIFENNGSQQPDESNLDEQIPLPPDRGLPSDPSKWTVFQVGEFVARLTNENIREAFYESEMDGQALLLMTQEHLRDTMKIKLGPSLIISSEINKLRERAKGFSS